MFHEKKKKKKTENWHKKVGTGVKLKKGKTGRKNRTAVVRSTEGLA